MRVNIDELKKLEREIGESKLQFWRNVIKKHSETT
jgi:hypothetical protein